MKNWLKVPLILAVVLPICNICYALDKPENAATSNKSDAKSAVLLELEQLFFADQQRQQQAQSNDIKGQSDRQRIFELLANNQITSATGKAYAAIILQHTPKIGKTANPYKSTNPENHLLSYYLNKSAYEMGYHDAGWYSGAAMDRYLLSQGKPQKYGTHWRLNDTGTRYVMDPLDPNTTDTQRAALGIDSLEAIYGFIAEDTQKLIGGVP